MSSIEWTDETVNLAVGCARVSPGCEHCYAERFVHRQMQPAHVGLTVMGKGEKGPRWNGKVRFLPERLDVFQSMKKPKRIFINSLSDTFSESLSHEQRAAMFGAFLLAPQHTYQVLTKRPHVALDFELWLHANVPPDIGPTAFMICAYYSALGVRMGDAEHARTHAIATGPDRRKWWIGVTAEDQQRATERLPYLLSLTNLPTKRFVSYEPALGPVNFRVLDWLPPMRDPSPYDPTVTLDALTGLVRGPDEYAFSKLDWIIVGGESGPGARPFDLAWARSTIEQCKAAGVPCFVKQLGANVRTRNDDNFTIDDDDDARAWPLHLVDEDRIEHDPDGRCELHQGAPVRVRLRDRKGGDMAEWSSDLRVREFPEARS